MWDVGCGMANVGWRMWDVRVGWYFTGKNPGFGEAPTSDSRLPSSVFLTPYSLLPTPFSQYTILNQKK